MATFSAIVTGLAEIFTLGFKAYNLYQEAKAKGWVKDGRTLSQAIDGAKTDEDRANLSKLLFEHRS